VLGSNLPGSSGAQGITRHCTIAANLQYLGRSSIRRSCPCGVLERRRRVTGILCLLQCLCSSAGSCGAGVVSPSGRRGCYRQERLG
jgi:hypothetical protein